MSDIKRIDIAEFRKLGYLQEANRLFFHPLGLALEVNVDDETGEETLSGVWDYRHDPEGVVFEPSLIDKDKIDRVAQERDRMSATRRKTLGFRVQTPTHELPE